MTTTTPSALSALDHDQVEHARALVTNTLKSHGLTRAELRAALQPGYGLAAYRREHPALWEAETPRDRAANAAGRLLLRFSHELHLPFEAPQGPSALTIAEELLDE
jgi:hypothetical protein